MRIRPTCREHPKATVIWTGNEVFDLDTNTGEIILEESVLACTQGDPVNDPHDVYFQVIPE